MQNWSLNLCLLLASTLSCLSVEAGYIGGDIAAGLPAAGLLGNYAGAFSGGLAVAKLDGDVESHDFSDDAATHEHLGELGAQLSEHSFPADYGSSDAGLEYAEHEEATAAASEHQYEALQLHGHEHEHEHELHELDSYDSKPVPGIDHGKGAFSYSSLYEFKDQEHEAQHELHV